jgi:hypothetical protein
MVIQEADDEKADAERGSSKRRRFLTLPVVMLVMHNWLPVLLQVGCLPGGACQARGCGQDLILQLNSTSASLADGQDPQRLQHASSCDPLVPIMHVEHRRD